jgi:hypothetical protein
MPVEFLKDGDNGFIGLNSRDNPSTLPQGYVTKSQNFRLDKGIATVRKGLQRKTSSVILNQKLYGTCTILDLTGQEIFVLAVTDGLYTYNPQTEAFSSKIAFPAGETIVDADVAPPYSNGVCDMVVAIDKIYISSDGIITKSVNPKDTYSLQLLKNKWKKIFWILKTSLRYRIQRISLFLHLKEVKKTVKNLC